MASSSQLLLDAWRAVAALELGEGRCREATDDRGARQDDTAGCKVAVETPVNLTTKQKELLREFDQALKNTGGKHSPRTTTWLDGVKKFFDDMKP